MIECIHIPVDSVDQIENLGEVLSSCQLPNSKHPDLSQTRPGDRAHSPHQLDRQVVKEFQFGVGIDNH
jgi:hypothetical protein